MAHLSWLNWIAFGLVYGPSIDCLHSTLTAIGNNNWPDWINTINIGTTLGIPHKKTKNKPPPHWKWKLFLRFFFSNNSFYKYLLVANEKNCINYLGFSCWRWEKSRMRNDAHHLFSFDEFKGGAHCPTRMSVQVEVEVMQFLSAAISISFRKWKRLELGSCFFFFKPLTLAMAMVTMQLTWMSFENESNICWVWISYFS